MQRHLYELLRDALHTGGAHDALVIGGRHYSYDHLRRRVAAALDAFDECSAERVGVWATNAPDTYAALLAALLSGRPYVVLHPSYPPERNARIVRQAGLRCLCGNGGDAALQALARQGGLRLVDLTDRFAEERELPAAAVTDRPAYIIFTSGSTGEPKGVPISRANLDAFHRAYAALGWQVGAADRFLQMFELTFDVSVVSTLFPLSLGASLYTVENGGMKHLEVFALLEDERITSATLTPSLLQLMTPYFGEIRLPALRYVGLTAEASQAALIDAFRPCVPHAAFVNLYGPTEATIYCTAYRLPATGAVKQHHGMVAIGRPFAGMVARIADETGREVPPGEQGELWIAGPQVMAGYLDAPDKSATAFVRLDGTTFYRTGDCCYRDAEGDIVYCGRRDNQVKMQGFRIELSEIEHAARAYFEEPCEAVVVPRMAEGICQELHLAVETTHCDTAALGEFLKARLPYYMLPKAVHCCARFPVTNSNKIDRKRLAEII